MRIKIIACMMSTKSEGLSSKRRKESNVCRTNKQIQENGMSMKRDFTSNSFNVTPIKSRTKTIERR